MGNDACPSYRVGHKLVHPFESCFMLGFKVKLTESRGYMQQLTSCIYYIIYIYSGQAAACCNRAPGSCQSVTITIPWNSSRYRPLAMGHLMTLQNLNHFPVLISGTHGSHIFSSCAAAATRLHQRQHHRTFRIQLPCDSHFLTRHLPLSLANLSQVSCD